MEAIQQFLRRKKKRIYFGMRMYGAMILAGALTMLLLAHGDVNRILAEMMPVVITTLTVLAAFFVSLIVIHFKMVINLDGFTSEEKSRILREAGKMPQVYDFLITSDVLIVVIRYRAYALPVKDIVWAYGTTTEHTSLYHSGNLYLPLNQKSHYLVVVMKDGRKVQIPLSAGGKNWEAEVKYAYTVIERKRPKAFLGFLEEMRNPDKKEFEAMVSFVEEGGTTDGRDLEVQYGLNHWYQQEIPGYDVTQNENIHGVLRAEIEGVLFVVLLFGIVLAGLFFYFVPVFDANGDVIAGVLQTNMWRFFAPVAVLAALPVAMLIVYIKTVLCDPHRRKYRRLHAVYMIFIMSWSLFLIAFTLVASGKVHGLASLQDYRIYRSGQAETYQGELVLTESPVDVERGVRILTEEGVYYVQSPVEYYKIPKDMYDGSELMQGNYTISYLPNTKYVISLKDLQGNERLKLSGENTSQEKGALESENEVAVNPDTEWKYGDMVYAKNPNIYGYEKLTEDEQKVFDFLYSREKTKELEKKVAAYTTKEAWDSTSVLAETFTIPAALGRDSCQRVMKLFEANQKFDFYDPVRYGIQKTEDGKVTEMYTGMQLIGEPLEANGYHLAYEKLVKEAVAQISEELPKNATEQEKLKKIKSYFKKECKPFDEHKWFSKVSGGEEKDQKIYDKLKLAKTGYGLLKTGSGQERGFMEAFGAIARELGLAVVPVINDDELQYWNKVCVDGKWYNIDLYQMAVNPSEAEKYDMVSDRQMKQNGITGGTYGGEASLELP